MLSIPRTLVPYFTKMFTIFAVHLHISNFIVKTLVGVASERPYSGYSNMLWCCHHVLLCVEFNWFITRIDYFTGITHSMEMGEVKCKGGLHGPNCC